jgi:hypothetical protein
MEIFYVVIITLRAMVVSWHLPDWTGENHQKPPTRIFDVASEFRTRRLANASSKSSPFQPSCTFGGGELGGGMRLHVLNTHFFTPILFKLLLLISHVREDTSFSPPLVKPTGNSCEIWNGRRLRFRPSSFLSCLLPVILSVLHICPWNVRQTSPSSMSSHLYKMWTSCNVGRWAADVWRGILFHPVFPKTRFGIPNVSGFSKPYK